MKQTVLIILSVLILAGTIAFSAIYSREHPACPPEDVVTMAVTPFGALPLLIPKGYYDTPGAWMTKEQFEAAVKD